MSASAIYPQLSATKHQQLAFRFVWGLGTLDVRMRAVDRNAGKTGGPVSPLAPILAIGLFVFVDLFAQVPASAFAMTRSVS